MQFGPRTLLFVILLLAMPIAAYLFMFEPLRERKDAAIHDIELKEKKLQQLSTAMAQTREREAELASLKKAIDYLQGKLPAQKEMDQVLKQIWEKAEKNGLNAKSVRSLKAIEGPNYSEQPIKMVIVGPFNPGFFKFLGEVEQMQRLTRINEMKIDADEKVNGVVTADIVMTIYFEPAEKVAVVK